MNPAPARSKGFTLLELSIVLMLIGIVMGMGLVTFSAYLQSSQFNATVKKMDDIEKALLNFVVANNRIPCPSDVTQTVGSTTYGYEAGAGSGSSIGIGTGACTGTAMLPQANFSATNGQVEGGIPTRALQLPDSYMYDGWGRAFSFAVDPTATVKGTLPPQAGAAWCGDPLTVLDSTGVARSTQAIYVIVSHGANGHGAYTSGGAALSASSVNQNEQINCHCDNNGVSQGYPIATYQPSGNATGLTTPTYVEMAPTIDSATGADYGAIDNFDDIVTFREPWQMQTQNVPLLTTASTTSNTCIYVEDATNHWVAQYSSNGTYLNQLSCAHAGSPAGTIETGGTVALDPHGNLWLSDLSACRVTEFSPTSANNTANCPGTIGSYIRESGVWTANPGGVLGKFGDAGAVAVDNYGNIWLGDASGSRIEMMSGTSFTWVGQVGCNGNVGCSPGTADGQLGTNGGGNWNIAFDKNNNLWVTDQANGRVQEFTINYNNVVGGTGAGLNMGTWVQTIGGGPGCAGGYVSSTSCSNTNGNSTCCAPNASSCTCINYTTFGTTYMGMGNFRNPQYIAIDPDGSSLWVNDGGSYRLEKFAISGSTSTLVQVIGGGGGGGPTCPNTGACTVSTLNCAPCTSTSTCSCQAGAGNGQLHTPEGIAFDPHGNIWVVDNFNNRVEEFNPATGGINASGQYILTGTGTCTDPSGNYCTGYVSKFGTTGAGAGQFENPTGIAISR